MKPLCTKAYLHKIFESIFLLVIMVMYVMLIINLDKQPSWLIIIIPLTPIIILEIIDTIYWIFQPNVLIYQYETGIVIKQTAEIEYTSIEKVYYKSYIYKLPRKNYEKATFYGTIFIKLKSGKTHKIRNAYYPIEAVDILSRIKQQKKFR